MSFWEERQKFLDVQKKYWIGYFYSHPKAKENWTSTNKLSKYNYYTIVIAKKIVLLILLLIPILGWILIAYFFLSEKSKFDMEINRDKVN